MKKLVLVQEIRSQSRDLEKASIETSSLCCSTPTRVDGPNLFMTDSSLDVPHITRFPLADFIPNIYSLSHCLGRHTMQCWTLSTIPSAPSVFSSENLYQYRLPLFKNYHWRQYGEINQGFPLDYFVYIWKDRNKKLYNGCDFSSMDAIDLETRECNTWFLAKEEIEPGESTI